ncbi:bifunctional 23S rRNA (guanine(2069)-N(7))-methyltransferase RlmK/23S rRNA (guanine(2445)-N(2))-methyltransferase RlmL [Kangiella sp.]|uniref:bifunctional 23S rRNA (guanine(2069)-N(7))-methyltransferase RlmK/23S rRNA (guanine(2445)-N(2))-methyltransferase RlmL n=1 Tax=Kangiella sp. TaxID=1920245 RepID=UPI0019CDBD12|nr:bifunctional 23S rRNA (guanine(2069)-N(7))-methyltransferase RlmK/23S rRNA (guanine(2445)-N(2))-methyltransferase RlmL [Kangiella sp.]MBD3652856.1 bifunctional 23S rRNA (guanine(2069)-N(7))-methyltransferase RlmK/23S rRNA (guanine(2445)-N(2))-methyltransferase RlmL [Kangiella sp.]
MQFYASCPKGVEALLIDELTALGASNLKEHPSHIVFEGDLELAYKACLHSRLANRVYLCLLDEEFNSVEDMYQKVNSIEWSWHFDMQQTFVVDAIARKNSDIRHSGFASQKVKDAVVDYYQERFEQRPSVDKDNPDYRIHAIINGRQLKIGIDLAGRSLHQRGYRPISGRAPIKENLAAALLIRAGWPELSKKGYSFHDPMCGTGTLLVEAAMIACDMAPGLFNPSYSFENWKQHDAELWQTTIATARRQFNKNKLALNNRFIGSDSHRKSLELAKEVIRNAEFAELIELKEQDIRRPRLEAFSEPGLLLSNPPYAERLGEEDEVMQLYRDFGDYIKSHCIGWQAAIITNEPAFAKAMGMRSHKQYKFKNGAIDCQLYLFDVKEENFYKPFDPTVVNPDWDKNLSEGAVMLKNRMIKNQQRLKSYLKQNDVTCYRLYDADLPEYSAAIDVYDGMVHIQEYAPPKDIPAKVAQRRLNEIVRVTSGLLQIPEAEISLKQRQRQKGDWQYQKQSDEEQFQVVHEQGLQFYVNLNRYLDTGLFLDHRKTRKMIMAEAKDKRFLNLFAYTGSVSVYAAKGGAKTTTVDMSKTYLNWAIKNFGLNNIPIYGHEFIQSDCLQWLEEAQGERVYDLIFLDPPTFSNSKRMETTFDVQRDQVELIRQTMNLLDTKGKLYFSNNFKKFEMEKELMDSFDIQEITARTLPMDFQKSRNHHRCWLIQHKS